MLLNMLDHFDQLRGGVCPLFWPILWLQLAWLDRQLDGARPLILLTVTWFGGVQIRRIIDEDPPTWRDELYAAWVGYSRAVIDAVFKIPDVRIARFVCGHSGTPAFKPSDRLLPAVCDSS